MSTKENLGDMFNLYVKNYEVGLAMKYDSRASLTMAELRADITLKKQ